MKENKSRKEWLKTIAIIFLSVMLVLTFFANTIRNYSLPEVATQYVGSDNLTTKIRGTGTVESQDPYSVVLKQSRKIASVKVKVGDEIEKGQVLYELEEGESEELKKAQADLVTLKAAYEKALITGQVSTSDRKAVESGRTGTIEQKQAKIDAAQRKVDQYENEIKNLENELNRWKYNKAGDIAEINAVNEADKALRAWGIERDGRKNNMDAAERDRDAAKAAYDALDVSDNDLSGDDPKKIAYDKAYNAYVAAEKKYNESVSLYNIAVDEYNKNDYIKKANNQVVENKLPSLIRRLNWQRQIKMQPAQNFLNLLQALPIR